MNPSGIIRGGPRQSRFYEEVPREDLQKVRQQRFRATGPFRLPPRIPCVDHPCPTPTAEHRVFYRTAGELFPAPHGVKPARPSGFRSSTPPLPVTRARPPVPCHLGTPTRLSTPPHLRYCRPTGPTRVPHPFRQERPASPVPTPSEPRYTAAEYQDVVQRRLEMAVSIGVIDASQYRPLLQLLIPAPASSPPRTTVHPAHYSPQKFEPPAMASYRIVTERNPDIPEEVVLLDNIAPPRDVPLCREWHTPTSPSGPPAEPTPPCRVPPIVPRLKGDLEKLPR
jgi:hypothetical protein